MYLSLGHLLAWVSAAPMELNLLLSVCTQGFISGFALIPPWAMQEYRAYGTRYRRVHTLTKVFTCTYGNEYSVLTEVFTRTYGNEYDALTEVFTRTYGNEYDALTKESTSHLL